MDVEHNTTEIPNDVENIEITSLKQENDICIQNDSELVLKETKLKTEYEELYTDHIIKDEIVIGPETIQNNKDTFLTDVIDGNRTQNQGEKLDHPINQDFTYMCDICSKYFKRRPALLRHIKTHDNKKVFKKISCKLCNKAFSTYGGLGLHKKYHCSMNKNKEKPVTCQLCKKAFPFQGRLLTHLKLSCPVIISKAVSSKLGNKMSTSQGVVKSNIKYKSRKKDREKEVSRTLCNKVVSSEEILKCHIQNSCQFIKNRALKHDKEDRDTETINSNFMILHTEYEEFYQNHIANDEIVQPEVNPNICSNGDLSSKLYESDNENFTSYNTHERKRTCDEFHERQELSRLYTCDICNKSFSHKKAIRTHMNTHRSISPKALFCNRCKKLFSSQGGLNQHMRFKCPLNKKIPKPVSCLLCKKVFGYPSNLVTHLKRYCPMSKHKIKPVSCKLCKKVLSSQKQVDRHLQSHCPMNENRAPVLCKLCYRYSSSEENLKRHLKLFCPVKVQKRVSCEQCEKVFYSQKFLDNHINKKQCPVINNKAITNISSGRPARLKFLPNKLRECILN